MSRTCVTRETCSRGGDVCGNGSRCSGVSTFISGNYCSRNCIGQGNVPSDASCAPGFACDAATLSCKSIVGRACTTKDSYYDCNGPNCDAVTLKCVANQPCDKAAECADGYGCGATGCYRYCTVEVATCQDNRACNMTTQRCE